MFTAVDTVTNTAVSVEDMTRTDRQTGYDSQDGRTPFQCLGCGEPLTYRGERSASPSGPFVHENGEECLNDGNASKSHRITQQGVAKELYNWLPGIETDQIGIERRIGTVSDFLIADIVVDSPIGIVVEIVCSGSMNLKRRLQTMRKAGYIGMFVVVSSGQWSATQIEQYLQPFDDIRVGRFDPATLDLRFGSLLTADRIDFESTAWDQLPEYVS